MMEYKFIIKPIVISAPTEEDAWDELFHQYDIDPDNVEISVECIGDSDDISHIFDNVSQEEFEKIAKELTEWGTEKFRTKIQGGKE